MARIVVTEFVSIDGVMEAPGGEPGYLHGGWAMPFMGADEASFKLGEVRDAQAHVLGRVTYESFAGAWPTRTGEFADKINAMPKYVVSSTLRNPTWNNTHVLRGDVAEEVGRLKQRESGVLLVAGSRMLVHALLEHGLVDEIRLMVFPVVLGSGRRIFPETPRKTVLRLTDVHRFNSGVLVQTYVAA
jgi:dihydrofolate reductase